MKYFIILYFSKLILVFPRIFTLLILFIECMNRPRSETHLQLVQTGSRDPIELFERSHRNSDANSASAPNKIVDVSDFAQSFW